jgi:hypothetical protein
LSDGKLEGAIAQPALGKVRGKHLLGDELRSPILSGRTNTILTNDPKNIKYYSVKYL